MSHQSNVTVQEPTVGVAIPVADVATMSWQDAIMERKRVNRERQDVLVNTINAKKARCATLEDEASKLQLWDEIHDARAEVFALAIEEEKYLDPALNVARDPELLKDDFDEYGLDFTREEVDGEVV